MAKSKRVSREFVTGLFTHKDKLRIQEAKETIHYHFTDNINKIDKIVNDPYKEVVAILI